MAEAMTKYTNYTNPGWAISSCLDERQRETKSNTTFILYHQSGRQSKTYLEKERKTIAISRKQYSCWYLYLYIYLPSQYFLVFCTYHHQYQELQLFILNVFKDASFQPPETPLYINKDYLTF